MEKVESSYNANEVEESVQEFWKREDIYARVRSLRRNGPPFFFVDGPPYTTGYIHLGTAWNKILKDTILRFHRMQGRHVLDRAGYDMHGLPIEVKVEHALGFTTKKDIEAYGIGPFIEQCREFALRNKDIMSGQFRRLGVWLDFDNPYQTLSREYIAAAWWTLKRAEEEQKLEKGYRVVNWCPRCETAIADAEVEYWEATDPSIFVKFPVEGKKNEYLIIWTTTPWTLPANIAVAVHPSFLYVRVSAKKDGREEFLWVADDLAESVLRKGRYQNYEITERKVGSDLVGLEYRSPLEQFVPIQKNIIHRVVPADFVTLENTGMVHIAPGHGWDDYLLGLREHLEIFCPVDGSGHFTREGGKYAGLSVKDANPVILDDLGASLISRGEVVHRYGHCWRCKKPIIFRATEQWFLTVSDIREQMLAQIAEVKWFPEWAGSARFHDWVKEVRDWCISRQRFWGIPIPIWQCPECHSYRVMGSFEELEALSGAPLLDPHRPYVDMVTIPCPCGGSMRRVEDIFDVWFDSAVASWATLKFPGVREEFDQYWPADFITEGQDQTRGWFYSQLGASTIAFGRAPYRRVLMHGFALDAEGRKMSKSLGNMVSPEEIIAQFGADVLRLYVLSASAPWDDLKFNQEGVKTVNRTVNILWNVYRFPLPYMILDRFTPVSQEGLWDPEGLSAIHSRLSDEDRWILSRINSVAQEVEVSLQDCQLHHASRAILSFILDDLSRWYIQLIRPRMWLEEAAAEKEQAYQCLYHVLRRLLVLLAPFAPHITEKMYGNLRLPAEPESLHLQDWIHPNERIIDQELEGMMRTVMAFDDAVAAARQVGRRKLRWPVAECVVATENPEVRKALMHLHRLCRLRANSRKVNVSSVPWDRIIWKPVPVMKEIGPVFGKDAPRVKILVEQAEGAWLKKTLEAEGHAILGEQRYEITSSQVTFQETMPDNFFAAPMKDATVYVDCRLTPELETEGYAREIIRRLQEMRRQLDLRVEDFITAEVTLSDARVYALLKEEWADLIGREVRASIFHLSLPPNARERSWNLQNEWDIEEITVRTSVSRLD
ncbi:MAG: isoleucine--tRNA ligase [Methanomicrobiales archaeon]|nr:isoleucine--tRNA ligase [Methanomicrobiales archaeon]